MLGQKVHLENEEANSQKHGTPKTTYVLSESQQNKKLFFFWKLQDILFSCCIKNKNKCVTVKNICWAFGKKHIFDLSTFSSGFSKQFQTLKTCSVLFFCFYFPILNNCALCSSPSKPCIFVYQTFNFETYGSDFM